MPNLPEFSEQNYKIVGYVVAALVTLSGGFLIYEVLFNSDLTFKANWNMFKSPLGNISWFIGFICAIVFWGKMGHWSRTPVKEYRDSYGNVLKREEDYDVTEQGFAKILLPIIGHFGIEPLVYGALIYYPIQCVIALVGAIFPYVLTAIVLAIIAGAWLYTSKCHFRYHSAVLVLLGVLFTVGFAWGGYALMNAEPGSTIQMLADTPANIEGEAEDYDPGMDDQFEGYGEEGLLGSLPVGTTTYVGKVGDTESELAITKDSEGNVTGKLREVNDAATMHLDGESLPAMGGDISFYGHVGSATWVFNLTGDANSISGTVSNGNGEMSIKMRKR